MRRIYINDQSTPYTNTLGYAPVASMALNKPVYKAYASSWLRMPSDEELLLEELESTGEGQSDSDEGVYDYER